MEYHSVPVPEPLVAAVLRAVADYLDAAGEFVPPEPHLGWTSSSLLGVHASWSASEMTAKAWPVIPGGTRGYAPPSRSCSKPSSTLPAIAWRRRTSQLGSEYRPRRWPE